MSEDKNAEIQNQILMSKRIAEKWLTKTAQAEYRVDIYFTNPKEAKMIPSLLRSFRDGRATFASVGRVSDLGVAEHGDTVTIWSSNREGVIQLKDHFEERGFETSGVW